MIAASPHVENTKQPKHSPAAVDLSKEPLQVRIPTAVKRRFKAHAAMRGLEPNALFVEIWTQYEASLPTNPSAQTET